MEKNKLSNGNKVGICQLYILRNIDRAGLLPEYTKNYITHSLNEWDMSLKEAEEGLLMLQMQLRNPALKGFNLMQYGGKDADIQTMYEEYSFNQDIACEKNCMSYYRKMTKAAGYDKKQELCSLCSYSSKFANKHRDMEFAIIKHLFNLSNNKDIDFNKTVALIKEKSLSFVSVNNLTKYVESNTPYLINDTDLYLQEIVGSNKIPSVDEINTLITLKLRSSKYSSKIPKKLASQPNWIKLELQSLTEKIKNAKDVSYEDILGFIDEYNAYRESIKGTNRLASSVKSAPSKKSNKSSKTKKDNEREAKTMQLFGLDDDIKREEEQKKEKEERQKEERRKHFEDIKNEGKQNSQDKLYTVEELDKIYGGSDMENLLKKAEESVKRKEEAYYKYLAFHDEKTGLFNDRAYKKAKKCIDKKSDVLVIYFDANNLKYINDTLSHSAGDKLIKHIADTITAVYGYGFRVGGDEFVTLLPHDKKCLEKLCNELELSVNKITKLHERVLENIKESLHRVKIEVGKKEKYYSVAIGYGTGAGERLEDIIQAADEAMYEDKKIYKKNHPEFQMRKEQDDSKELSSKPAEIENKNKADNKSNNNSNRVSNKEKTTVSGPDMENPNLENPTLDKNSDKQKKENEHEKIEAIEGVNKPQKENLDINPSLNNKNANMSLFSAENDNKANLTDVKEENSEKIAPSEDKANEKSLKAEQKSNETQVDLDFDEDELPFGMPDEPTKKQEFETDNNLVPAAEEEIIDEDKAADDIEDGTWYDEYGNGVTTEVFIDEEEEVSADNADTTDKETNINENNSKIVSGHVDMDESYRENPGMENPYMDESISNKHKKINLLSDGVVNKDVSGLMYLLPSDYEVEEVSVNKLEILSNCEYEPSEDVDKVASSVDKTSDSTSLAKIYETSEYKKGKSNEEDKDKADNRAFRNNKVTNNSGNDNDITDKLLDDDIGSYHQIMEEDDSSTIRLSGEGTTEENKAEENSVVERDFSKALTLSYTDLKYIIDAKNDLAKLSVIENQAYNDGYLVLEAVEVADGSLKLILFNRVRRTAYLVDPLNNSENQYIVVSFLLKSNKIEKICYNPYPLYQFAKQYHYKINNLNSLLIMQAVAKDMAKTAAKGKISLFDSNNEPEIEKDSTVVHPYNLMDIVEYYKAPSADNTFTRKDPESLLGFMMAYHGTYKKQSKLLPAKCKDISREAIKKIELMQYMFIVTDEDYNVLSLPKITKPISKNDIQITDNKELEDKVTLTIRFKNTHKATILPFFERLYSKNMLYKLPISVISAKDGYKEDAEDNIEGSSTSGLININSDESLLKLLCTGDINNVANILINEITSFTEEWDSNIKLEIDIA